MKKKDPLEDLMTHVNHKLRCRTQKPATSLLIAVGITLALTLLFLKRKN